MRLLGPVIASSALGWCAMAADEKTQTVDAKGLTFAAPASWKSSPPKSQMRAAQLAIEPVQGDKDRAELIVFRFDTSAGTVAANIDRWEKQFTDSGGQSPKAKTETVKGKNVDVTRVETSGAFTDRLAGGGTKPGYRLLGAIVESPSGAAYFLKLVGPDKTVTSVRKEFDKMLKTIAVD
jgi:hypothetical protein